MTQNNHSSKAFVPVRTQPQQRCSPDWIDGNAIAPLRWRHSTANGSGIAAKE